MIDAHAAEARVEPIELPSPYTVYESPSDVPVHDFAALEGIELTTDEVVPALLPLLELMLLHVDDETEPPGLVMDIYAAPTLVEILMSHALGELLPQPARAVIPAASTHVPAIARMRFIFGPLFCVCVCELYGPLRASPAGG